MKIKNSIILDLGLLLLAGCSSKTGTIPEKPNIVVIMADDMGYSDLGCYGGEISTPNIDKLAHEGVRFKKIYNCARCCPTRASLLTGLYPHNAGIGKMTLPKGKEGEEGPFQGYLKKNTPTIAEALKEAGYNSYLSGKWHVGEGNDNWPLKRGFQKYFGLISGASSYFELIKNQKRRRQMALDDTPYTPPSQGFYMTDAITSHAIRWIKDSNQHEEKPFFLMVAYTAPHWPLHALKEDIAKYDGKYNVGWDTIRKRRFINLKREGLIDKNVKLSQRPKHIPAWKDVANKQEWADKMEVYAAMVDRMDQGVGRIIDELKKQGKYENTVFMILSDNGASDENIEGRGLNDISVPIGHRGSYLSYKEPWANVSNTPFRYYKKTIYEGGIASPFIFHWPAKVKQHGRVESHISHVYDIMPTILDIAGVKLPLSKDSNSKIGLDGISILPALLEAKQISRKYICWEHYGNKAIVEGDWKLVKNSGHNWELFCMKNDVTETNNLASLYPEKVKDLVEKYNTWEHQVGISSTN